MRPIAFSVHSPGAGRRHFVTEADVRVLLERLPEEVWERLAAVHFNDRSRGRRNIGYVRRGRHEIDLCALPVRVSLASWVHRHQSPLHFGAVRGCQWPSLAVRRFMLYDVFLHELGHLQVVDVKATNANRKFASETLAQEFADHWRHHLWSQQFDHPDPVHRPPSAREIEAVRTNWIGAHGDYKKALLLEKTKRYEEAVALFAQAVAAYPMHSMALERLGVLTYAGLGTTQSYAGASELLMQAVEVDPALCDATLFLAMALARQDRERESRCFFERAIRIDPYPPLALTKYADSIADWGYFDEAEALFQKAIKKDDRCVVAIRDYGRTLIRDHNPAADDNLPRAIALFERALGVDPLDAESHYRLGNALWCVDGLEERAIDHVKRALALSPTHKNAAAMLADIAPDAAAAGAG